MPEVPVPNPEAEHRNILDVLNESASKNLLGLLKDPEVRAVCLEALRNVGCKPPSDRIVLAILEKAIQGTASFLGSAFQSRLQEFLSKQPAIRSVLEKIERLNRQSSDQGALKARMLADLGSTDRTTVGPKVDEATEFEILLALHQGSRLDVLDANVNELFQGLQSDLQSYYSAIFEPPLSWNLQPADSGADQSAVDAIRYNSGRYQFAGRESELALLKEFLGSCTVASEVEAFKWLLITGPGGEGKSRLALRLTQSLDPVWKAGRLALSSLRKFEPEKWRPRQPTLFVIDYPAQSPGHVHELLSNLQCNAASYDFPVRVLMLERDATGEWYETVFTPGSASSAVLAHCFRRAEFEHGLELQPLQPNDIVQAMRSRFEDACLAPPADSILLNAARRVDARMIQTNQGEQPYPRALFAIAAAEIMVRASQSGETDVRKLVEELDRQSVLDSLIRRDRDTRWRLMPSGADAASLELHENLLALASMCMGLDRGRLAEAISDEARKLLPDLTLKGTWPLSTNLMQSMSGGAHGYFNQLEPDILGEYFVLRLMEQGNLLESDKRCLINAAWQISPIEMAEFLKRTSHDLPSHPMLSILQKPPTDQEAIPNWFQAVTEFPLEFRRLEIGSRTALETAIAENAVHAKFGTVSSLLVGARSRNASASLIDLIWTQFDRFTEKFAAGAFTAPIEVVGYFFNQALAQGKSDLVAAIWAYLAADPQRLAQQAFATTLDKVGSFLETATRHKRKEVVDSVYQALAADPQRLAQQAFATSLENVGSFLETATRHKRQEVVDSVYQALAADPRRLAQRAFATSLENVGSFLETATRHKRQELIDSVYQALAADPQRLAQQAFATSLENVGSFLETATRHKRKEVVDSVYQALAADPQRLAQQAFATSLENVGSFLETATRHKRQEVVDSVYQALAADPRRLAQRAFAIPLEQVGSFLDTATRHKRKDIASLLWSAIANDAVSWAWKLADALPESLGGFLGKVPRESPEIGVELLKTQKVEHWKRGEFRRLRFSSRCGLSRHDFR